MCVISNLHVIFTEIVMGKPKKYNNLLLEISSVDLLISGIIENMTELKPEVCLEAVNQGVLPWLFKRIKVCLNYVHIKLNLLN